MIKKILSTAKVNLLGWFPVAIARRHMQGLGSAMPGQESAEDTKQLLVDVSVIIKDDAKTGIQRVVRALLLQLLMQPPVGYRVRPVFATRKHGYHYAPDGFGLSEAPTPNLAGASPVQVEAGDIFLGLDLAAHLLPRHQGELARWKRLGAEIHVVVYDLLPVSYPDWFNPNTTRNFQRWLRTLAIFADRAVCISNVVKAELEKELFRQYSLARGAMPINVIPLGADIESSMPSQGLPENSDQLLKVLSRKPTILMVGTLEPRKGHDQVLAAFEELWRQGRDINLVIVGKPGWKTEELQHTLSIHPQRHHHLFWLENASDELLGLLYAAAAGVLVASRAEGYGLPLVEALSYGKPVLARDIPVFREIAGDKVSFFSDGMRDGLLDALARWLHDLKSADTVFVKTGKTITWKDSCNQLLKVLESGGINRPDGEHVGSLYP